MTGAALVRPIVGSLRAQAFDSAHNPADLLPIITMPAFSLVFMAVLDHTGRRDLTSHAVVAPFILSMGAMATLVTSQFITRERDGQTLEALVATPTHLALVLLPRVVLMSALTLVGLVESWLIAVVVFNASPTVYHPLLMTGTILLTVVASAGTSLLASALLCLARTPTAVRSLQNIVTYPLFLISGALVPASYLPDWLQPLSNLVFLHWSSSLLRSSMASGPPAQPLLSLAVLLTLGVVSGIAGALVLQRLLLHLKHKGTLAL